MLNWFISMFCIPNDICGNICIISVSRHRLLPWRNMVNQFGADFTFCNLNVLVFAVSSTLANTCTTAQACTCTHAHTHRWFMLCIFCSELFQKIFCRIKKKSLWAWWYHLWMSWYLYVFDLFFLSYCTGKLQHWIKMLNGHPYLNPVLRGKDLASLPRNSMHRWQRQDKDIPFYFYAWETIELHGYIIYQAVLIICFSSLFFQYGEINWFDG